uniref:toll-like receptor 13 isoform X1 n=1 Tax=Oncorhynchus gorbuscha TaxID=8017 RepID=UPI001EAEBD63|nr:toll-like receptor 13 isoform X1 [Oncorhynchus gorbuscha]
MELKITWSGKGNGSTYSQLSFFLCILLYFWVLFNPVNGYTMKHCRIRESLNTSVLCDGRNLNAIPADIPLLVRSVNIAKNNISQIKSKDFKDLKFLNMLIMYSNRISHVENGSFSDLVALEQLNLSFNKLTSLSDQMFKGLDNLTVLHLENNHISSIASSSFQLLFSLKVLNLTSNKLHCFKELQHILQLPSLLKLFIGNNSLNSLQSQEISNRSIGLTELDLSRNPLEIFSVTADIFPYLKKLDLSFCGINGSMEWDVADRYFLSNVSSLDLSGIHMSLQGIGSVLQSINFSLASLGLDKIGKDNLINVACHIPTLKTLRLQCNNFSSVSDKLLQSCTKVTDLDISGNNITDLSEAAFRSIKDLKTLRLGYDGLSSVPNATRNLRTLKKLDLSHNIIKTLGCSDFTNLRRLEKLYLNNNLISNLEGCVFLDLRALNSLTLRRNRILNLGKAFTKGLQHLKSLDLGFNKLTNIRTNDFKSLRSLEDLALYDNDIKTLEDGAFVGLAKLKNLVLLNNVIGKSEIRGAVFKGLRSLKTLNMASNAIKYEKDEQLQQPPFTDLSSLENLYIFSQHYSKYMRHSCLPSNFLEGLNMLSEFQAGNLHIAYLHPDTFIHTPQLSSLDISHNFFHALSPELFHPIPKLKRLTISKTELESLDFLIEANLTQVHFLKVRQNKITWTNETVLHSLPALTLLDMQRNPFICDCRNAWFVQWAESNNQTQVAYAHDYPCSYPDDLKDTQLLDLDTHSCSVDLGIFYFISTTSLVLLTLLGSFIYHLLRWQVVYAYYLFLAYLHDSKRRNRQTPHQYDAFVSYNTHDECWVVRELLPELEGEQGWKLCLHHRDFQPGKPIIENITDAIYRSRKTICVITHRYLQSEWCSREIQVASFRLFDEQKDVLILVFLEEIPDHQLSPYHRMRRLVKRRTYLSWPRAGEDTRVFWQKLQVALETRDWPAEENPILTGVERQ